jgi:hypothetical protein
LISVPAGIAVFGGRRRAPCWCTLEYAGVSLNIRLALVALGAAATLLLVAVAAHAEPAPRSLPGWLCAHREDRPDLGSPVHKAQGGGGLMHRLPNGHRVQVLRSTKGWHQVRYADPGPQVRSEPLRYTGWIKASYLRPCEEPAVVRLIGTGGSGDGRVADLLAAGGEGPSLAEVLSKVKGVSVARPAVSSMKVCWWNTKRLGHGTRDWDASALAIRGCDVVGLGEVMTADAASKLASYMPAGWKAVTSEKAVGRSTYREHYAVIYDEFRVDRVLDGTRGYFDDAEDRFEREPWAVTLRAGSFDFTAVLFHATWGDSAVGRVQELQHSLDAFAWFQAQDEHEDDVVLMGDFDDSCNKRPVPPLPGSDVTSTPWTRTSPRGRHGSGTDSRFEGAFSARGGSRRRGGRERGAAGGGRGSARGRLG